MTKKHRPRFHLQPITALVAFVLICNFAYGAELHSGMHRFHKRSVPTSGKVRYANPWTGTDWNRVAVDSLRRNIRSIGSQNEKRAKNVIMFLGDGLGLPTIASARVYKSQSQTRMKFDTYLFWENFPNLGLARTYNVDHSTPDSAGTATAYLSGIKANLGTIGVNENVLFNNCSNINGNRVDSILHKSIAQGKSTGVVTTTRVTHASPAGCYASTPCRDWEDHVPANATQCSDIAQQLILDDRNQDIKVIMGGGLKYFLPINHTLSSTSFNVTGTRMDNLNLLEHWKQRQGNMSHKYTFVSDKDQLKDVDPSNVDYLLGLFSSDHMAFELERPTTREPSLEEMTTKAIQILKKNDNGYFLFVEGGKIDHAHHGTNAFRALNDTLAFEAAVAAAYKATDPNDTLILVTADHSHVFTFGGYGRYEESVFGEASIEPSLDGMPYLQMSYGNGPGYKYHRNITGDMKDGLRVNLTDVDTTNTDFVQETAVWTSYETHGGEDVPVYSSGPWSHLFRSTEEQNYVAHVMMYASCVGTFTKESHCTGATIVGGYERVRGAPAIIIGLLVTVAGYFIYIRSMV